MSGAMGAAFGIFGAAIPLVVGFAVLDAVAGTVRCQRCGAEMHHTKQEEHVKTHTQKKQHNRASVLHDIDTEYGLGVEFPEVFGEMEW